MTRTSTWVLLVAASCVAGCQPEEASVSEPVRDAAAARNIVARVGGRPIGASDVAVRMASEDLDARAALEALIDEELLLAEARRRGIEEDLEARRGAERMMVRAMLRDLEHELAPEAISMKEVRADFAEHREKLQVPERRRSWHILVKGSSEAGRRLAESILREVRRADDPKAVYHRYAGGDGVETELEVSAEELPPMSTKAGIEKPYKDALFSAKSEGPLEQVVGTSYGWHAIVLTEIIPAQKRTVQDVEDEIRKRLSQKKRFEKLVEIVRKLEAEGMVQYDDRGVERLLSMAGLPERE